VKTLLPVLLDAAQGLRAMRSHRIAQQSRKSGPERMPGAHHLRAVRALRINPLGAGLDGMDL
jgi:hypothetical protein